MLANAERIHVISMLILDAGSYRDQVIRPYEMFLNQHDLSVLQDRVASVAGTAAGGRMPAAQFAEITASTLQPQMTFERVVPIDQGWRKDRQRFQLYLKVVDVLGHSKTYLISGYTNEIATSDGLVEGGSATVRIDDNAEFVINAVTEMAENIALSKIGAVMRVDSIQSQHVLSNNGPMGFSERPIQKIRPEDVCSHLVVQAATQSSRGRSIVAPGSNLSTSAALSDRTNSISSNYIAKMVNGYAEGTRATQFGEEPSATMATTRSIVQDKSAHRNPFLSFLGKLHATGTSSVFTIRDLVSIDPECRTRIKKFRIGKTICSGMEFAGNNDLASINPLDTQDWTKVDQETRLATIVSHSVPALCFETMLSGISFGCHNYSPNRQVEWATAGAWSVMSQETGTSKDLSSNIEAFRARFMNEVMPMLTLNGTLAVGVRVHSLAMDETRVAISIEGGRQVAYVTPSFADALLVPVLTNNIERPTEIANGFETLLESVVPGRGISNPLGKILNDSNFNLI